MECRGGDQDGGKCQRRGHLQGSFVETFLRGTESTTCSHENSSCQRLERKRKWEWEWEPGSNSRSAYGAIKMIARKEIPGKVIVILSPRSPERIPVSGHDDT